ncbi:hypothetical protein LT216_002632, partial [Enterococcus faecalis]|nr:hypothetical protein [Enterococcus faecalis]
KVPSDQSKMIVKKYKEFRSPRGILSNIDEIESLITSTSSANQFEEALKKLGDYLGFISERFDDDGIGPDVLWLINEKKGIIIEAKSRKKEHNAFRKEEHGQLLIAERWFKTKFPDIEALPVSVHQDKIATKASFAEGVKVLTFDNILLIIKETKKLYSQLIDYHLDEKALEVQCQKLLLQFDLLSERFVEKYLDTFETMT